MAGPFDSDAPEVMQGSILDLGGTSEVLGQTMKMISHDEEENEQEMMFAEEDVKHLDLKVDEMGVI